MNTKDLIEAAKFQASVKPQDEFMAELAERLETLYTANLKVCSDYDAACDELKKWQKLQPIICPACHRGCFSNDKFCPHCGTSLRNGKSEAPTENSITDKYPHCVLCSNGAILTESLEEYDKLIADISIEAVKEFAERFLKKIHENHYLLSDKHNSTNKGMFTIGIEQAVNETKIEMVGDEE